MEAVINDSISRELVHDATLLPLGNEMPLLDTGVLHSLSLLRLVVFVEERFGVMVDDADLVPEHFASVDAIWPTFAPGPQEGRARKSVHD